MVSWKLLQRENSLFFLQTRHKSEIMTVLKHLNKCITEEEKTAWFQLCVAEKFTQGIYKGGKSGDV